MLRKNLLLTTAFVVVGTLSFLAAQSAAIAAPVKVGAARDRNSEFLHNYSGARSLCAHGSFEVWGSSGELSSGHVSSGWQRVAVPITGTGRTVNRIYVEDGAESRSVGPLFWVGIYSNTPSGLPGKFITGATASAPEKCAKIEVTFRKTKLKRQTRYWIEETASAPRFSSANVVFWQLAPNSRRKAYMQTHTWSRYSSSFSHSYTSPWTLLSGAPFFRLGN